MRKSYSIVSRFTFSVSSHDENNSTVFRDLVEILEIIFLRVTNERSKAELGLGFLCNTNGVLLSSACLRAVENNNALLLMSVEKSADAFAGDRERETHALLHLGDKVAGVA